MRLANKSDIEVLSNLRVLQQKDDWKEEYEDKYNLYDVTKDYLEKHLNNDLFIFVLEIDNKIISTCGLQVIDLLPQCNDNGKTGYICNVYTDKKYRNRGYQTSLLESVIKYAKENNLCELILSSDNDVAISIYKKFGFKYDDWAMKLEIK